MEKVINYINCSKQSLENKVEPEANTIIQNTRNPACTYREHEGSSLPPTSKASEQLSRTGAKKELADLILRDPIKQFNKASSMRA